MKILSILAVLSLLSGCVVASNATDVADMGTPFVYRDTVTGCEYLTPLSGNGLTPRIAADGKTHRGCGEARP